MLGEDEELALCMDPEDGHFWVQDINDLEVSGFTQYGIECLKQIIADKRASNSAPETKRKPKALRCPPDANVE